MGLQTPDRLVAVANLLIDFDGPTVQFASVDGFQSVRFIDEEDPSKGVVLVLRNPVNNMEGQCFLNTDPRTRDPGTGAIVSMAYITPQHFVTGEDDIDELEANQVAILDIPDNSVPIHRINVMVIGMDQVLASLPGEPDSVPS